MFSVENFVSLTNFSNVANMWSKQLRLIFENRSLNIGRAPTAYTKTWTVDDGRWTMDDGRWTVNYGPFHSHAINHFVTSRIKHTPYETFLPVFFTIASRNQSLPGFLVRKSRFRLATGQDMYHLGLARQRKTISSGLF